MVVTLVLFFTLGRSFLPPFNEGSFTINVSTLPGVSLDESNRIGQQAEKLLLELPEIKAVARKTGRAELDEHALGVNTSEIEAPFVLGDRSHAEVVADVRKKLSVIPGVNIEIGQPISHRIDAMLSGTQARIAIKLFGDDLNRMFMLGNQIKKNECGATNRTPAIENHSAQGNACSLWRVVVRVRRIYRCRIGGRGCVAGVRRKPHIRFDGKSKRR